MHEASLSNSFFVVVDIVSCSETAFPTGGRGRGRDVEGEWMSVVRGRDQGQHESQREAGFQGIQTCFCAAVTLSAAAGSVLCLSVFRAEALKLERFPSLSLIHI